jgi:hypothetical protein
MGSGHRPGLVLLGSVSRRAAGTQSRSTVPNGWLGIEPAFFSASSRLRESLGGYGCCSSADVVHRAEVRCTNGLHPPLPSVDQRAFLGRGGDTMQFLVLRSSAALGLPQESIM